MHSVVGKQNFNSQYENQKPFSWFRRKKCAKCHFFLHLKKPISFSYCCLITEFKMLKGSKWGNVTRSSQMYSWHSHRAAESALTLVILPVIEGGGLVLEEMVFEREAMKVLSVRSSVRLTGEHGVRFLE